MAPRKRPSDVNLPQQGRIASKSGKLSVAPPASFKKFFILLLMHICKKILLIRTPVKLGIYLIGVTAGSLVSDMIPIPKTIFASKNFIINRFFVRVGWGWTCALLLAFVYLTGITVSCGNKQLVKKHMVRLGVATVWWFVCTSFFEYIEQITGYCSLGLSVASDFTTKKECRSNKGQWVAFDISGHAFLLVHCLMTISEEVRVINGWERIQEVIMNEEDVPSDRMTRDDLSKLKELYSENTTYIRILTVLITILTITWEMMLVVTTLYFHNMPQKLSGVVFSAIGWFVTHQVWYKMDIDSPWAPVSVGKGYVKYAKE